MNTNMSIEALPGTTSVTIKKLQGVGIMTYFDLINYFPSRYTNYPVALSIFTLQTGDTVTVKGKITSSKNSYARRGLNIQRVTITDGMGELELTWFNQPYLIKLLKVGEELSVGGVVKRTGNRIAMTPSEYELVIPGRELLHTGRVVPVYPEKRGLTSKTLRDKIKKVMTALKEDNLEWLPQPLIQKYTLQDENRAYTQIHFPKTIAHAEEAKKRLSFDELFTIQLSTHLIREEWKKEQVTNPIILDTKKKKKIDAFIHSLPFPLTGAQARCIEEIMADMSKTNPMNRFLQGDVGSGKTIVAAVASYLAYLNGYQTLVMVPTEILAEQHYTTFMRLLEPLGLKIGLQTGSNKIIKKTQNQTLLKYDIIIGTQALIQSGISFEKVGLIVIDEQHRFGVAQRAMLKDKGLNPHLLTMTATPIPRTVALTIYGELDMSIIDEMPVGRLPIKTHLVQAEKRDSGYEWIKEQIKEKGVQVFIICPFVEESEEETMLSVKAATKEYDRLKKEVFPTFKLGLLHGKMKSKEKDEVMKAFKNKEYDILVATSVVEVGIDVPNATIMMIEGAERFGLAQLHQLRGRVGRGKEQSYCFLYTSENSSTNTYRLQLFARTENGMELAEYDYKMRGAGEVYGTKQSGLSALMIADLSDLPLITKSKAAVKEFCEEYKLNTFPLVEERISKFRVHQIARD